MKRATILTAIALTVMMAALAAADVPEMINYQGRLENSSGDPIDTTVLMAFSICADSLGSACTWTEVHPSVVVTNGMFNVILGSVEPITTGDFNGPVRWLGVHVGDESLPYTRLVSASYAFHAAVADTASTVAGVSGAEVEQLLQRVHELEQRVAELEAQLRK